MGLLAVNLLLYIFGLGKNIFALEKTTRSLFIPFTTGLIVSILTLYLPDSHHLIAESALSFGVAEIFMLLTLLDKNKFIKATEEFFYALLQTMWISIILSVYRIYRISHLLFIIAGSVYLAGFIVLCIFIKRQTFIKYASVFVQYAFSVIFGFTTLVCLIYEQRLFGIIMFISSLTFMFGTILIIFQKNKPLRINEKTEKFIMTITVISSNALMGAGAILMQI